MDNQKDNSVKNAFFVTEYRDTKRPHLTHKMEIRKSFAGKKIRRFTGDEASAYVLGDQLVDQILKYGRNSVDSDGLTINRAAKWFFERLDTKLAAQKVGEKHVKDTKRVINVLCQHVGGKLAHFVESEEIEKVYSLPESSTTQANHYAAINALFQALVDFKKLDADKNPMTALEKPEALPRRSILTPGEMKQVLDAKDVMEDWLFASILVQGFPGIRTVEALRMNARDINCDSQQIHITDEVAKGTNSDAFDDRIIDFPPQLVRRKVFLRKYLKNRGDGKFLPVKDQAYYDARNRLVKHLGWDSWPDNCLRHSAATYMLAETGNPSIVANMLGHKTSIRLVNRTYAVPAKKADWKAWKAL